MRMLQYFDRMARDVTRTARKYARPFWTMMAIYVLGISAIIRADHYYIDDMGRALWGYRQFDYYGRYISHYLSVFLNADTQLTDISPLTQLLAAALMALSAVMVLRLLTGRERFSWLEYVAMVPLGLSPYFLECFSYKFDAPYMAISVLASVAPVLFENRGRVVYALSVFLGALTVCMSYQAASGIFPMLVLVLALKRWSREEQPLPALVRFVLLSAAAYLAGMAFFAGAIMPRVGDDVYASGSLPPLGELLPTICGNLRRYYGMVRSDFKKEWLVLTVLLLAGSVWAMVRTSRRKWYLALPVHLVGLALLLGMAFGLYPLLKSALFAPRAMYGFGALLCFAAVTAVQPQGRLWAVPGKAVCLALCWCFFIFAFTYGNALTVQKTYTDYRIRAVIDDLDELGLLDRNESRSVQIAGTIGQAPPLEAKRQDYQMLNRLVPVTFRDSSWYWGSFGFSNYYGLDGLEWDASVDLRAWDLPVVKESYYHTIRSDGERILIELIH